MAILSALRVSEVQDLRNEASRFQEHADGVKRVTDQMLELINSTKSLWRGEANMKYSTQFANLGDDMARIYAMCTEYSTDLQQIADTYQQAETENASTASALKADVELRF